ncbi:MAG: Gfo/Idh/MocA family oxidoreductase [Pirellulaceae bacterium]|jgi:predicted dehydrogenase|nr:Gfo/Idh/MocA family oxidoreductase [Pirellulaceae bacterium]
MILDTSLAGAGVWLASDARLQASTSPNEKLNIALVGAGGRGAANLAAVASERIVALCDVDGRRAASTYERFGGVPKYHDFRKMLDEMDKQIDAVVVSAPNHIHAPAAAKAMRMGKHCYCEKPLSHSVHEARTLAQIAADKKVATQMGTQIHASSNYRRVVELIQSGAIGPVREVHIRLAGGGAAGDRPRETKSVPGELRWDLWLGPAPYRPYHPCYVPHDWHYWWDFGGGALGNMGCHYLDLAFWALDLRYPTAIEAEGPRAHSESTPRPLTVQWEFPTRNELPPVKLSWNHGRKRPPFWETHELPDWAWGVFVGSKGMLLANYSDHALWPESQFADFKRPEPTIAESIGHHQEWILACKTGRKTTCNFDYAGGVSETVLLGNVAYRCGKRIEWDPVNLKIPNAPEAEQFLRRDYRKGWTL